MYKMQMTDISKYSVIEAYDYLSYIKRLGLNQVKHYYVLASFIKPTVFSYFLWRLDLTRMNLFEIEVGQLL